MLREHLRTKSSCEQPTLRLLSVWREISPFRQTKRSRRPSPIKPKPKICALRCVELGRAALCTPRELAFYVVH